jgi:hypothetical protein
VFAISSATSSTLLRKKLNTVAQNKWSYPDGAPFVYFALKAKLNIRTVICSVALVRFFSLIHMAKSPKYKAMMLGSAGGR